MLSENFKSGRGMDGVGFGHSEIVRFFESRYDSKMDIKKEIKNRGLPIVASVSGGKDSMAMALWLREEGFEDSNPVYYVWADTLWESPETYDYLRETVEPLHNSGKGSFHRVVSKKYPEGLAQAAVMKGAFPSRRMRWCSDVLKHQPIKAFIREVNEKHGCLSVNAVGIRAAESKARSAMLEWEPGSILGAKLCEFTWRPLITWVIADVAAIHARNNLKPCGVYLRDSLPAQRLGCHPCIMSRKDEIKAISILHPERIEELRELEEKVAEVATERHAKKGETFESLGLNRPTFFQGKDGTGECWPIDKVVEWSQTTYGGKQMMFPGVTKDGDHEPFIPVDDEEKGCAMFGLCIDRGD